MDDYYCYVIKSKSCNDTYTGITNDLDKRLKQHNGILAGGAKCTKKHNDWEYCKIMKFNDKQLAQSFEWHLKHKKSMRGKWIRVSGLDNKVNRIMELNNEYEFDIVL
jgi:putative endonuclease